jgi:hypothetical protein
VADTEILDNSDVAEDEDVLIHYGILRRSGRYPWGSGQSVQQSRDFLRSIESMRSKGLSDTEIAKGFGTTTTAIRAAHSIATHESRAADTALASRLKSKGLSNVAIGKRMGIPESTVRGLLAPSDKSKHDVLINTANMLRDKVGPEHYLDIGAGTENHLGISATKLATAVAVLREEGYVVHPVQTNQLGTGAGKKTTIKVLAPPGTTYGEINRNQTRIKSIAAFTDDGGHSYTDIKPPQNVNSKRIQVRYAGEGGEKADGVIYVRPGVPELSLGASRYSQVRIAVDGTHYLKGMAVYKDNLPKGTDLVFNTSKKDTGNKLDAMKPQKGEEENPFGSTVRQRYYTDAAGKKHLSPMNIVNEEGDWADWSRSLSSQVLSKQSPALARRQLGFALDQRKSELGEISRLTNPVVRKALLQKFADGADSAAVNLKAAALPGQRTHVIIPIPSLKEHEVYAPNYPNGTRLALVRFPHGGTFEIPEVTVNNRNREGNTTLGRPVPGNEHLKATDAIGIHPNVAARLSGADFDGDTVLAIPNRRGDLKTSPPLKNLEGFSPTNEYGPYHGMRTIDGGIYDAKTGKVDYGGKAPSGRAKQHQMGDVSNLITDMTIGGASHDELARAVRHSMVVIDAEKHHLNYKQSYLDNGIASLKAKYQGIKNGRLKGASTIISKASSEERVPARRLRRASEGGPIDLRTGEKVFVPTGESYTRNGKTIIKKVASTKLAEAKNALDLSSGMPIERVYAEHSNALKALANTARKMSITTGGLHYSPSAARTYAHEVSSLNAKLNKALKNKPLERQAQIIANAAVSAKRAANPGLEADALKKLKGQELIRARARVGAQKDQVYISDAEWRAIQEGAISTSKLERILENADSERVRSLATPRSTKGLSTSELAIAKARLDAGYTQAEVAESLGIPVSTLNSALKREGG